MPDDATDLERRVCSEILKITLKQYPPDYFTLLGISPTIDDPAAVDLAARQRAERLRKGTPQELIPAARYVLRRIEKARICLSDKSARGAYLDSLGLDHVNGSDQPRPRPKPVPSLKAGGGDTPTKPAVANTPPATLRNVGGSKTSTAVTNSSANEFDLSSLFTDFADEEVASNLIGLTDVPYKARTASNGQAVVYGSVAALSAIVLAIIGLIAFLAGTDPTANELPGPTQIAAEVANNTAAGANPASNAKPVDTALQVAPAALTRGETNSSKVATDLKDGVRADSSVASMESRVSAMPTGDEDSDTSSSPAAEVASIAPNSPEANPPPAGQPAVPSVARKELVAEIELPPLRTDQTATTAENVGSVTELGYLDDKVASSLRISVDEPNVKRQANTEFYVRRPDEAVALWEIRLKAEPSAAPTVDTKGKGTSAVDKTQLDGATEGFDEVIALLQLDGSGLKFRWGETKRATWVEQLRNCALVLTSDTLSHRIQLRPQLLAYKFMFDLSKSNHIYQVAEEHLPHADAIRFTISDVMLPGMAYELEPANGIIANGETLRIKTLDGNIPIEFQFVLSVTASKATVKFVPRHRLGRRWYPFTGSQVHGAINDLERAMADGRGRFSAAQSAMSSLPGQLSSIESRLRADSPDWAQIQSQRTLLMRQLNSARGAARRLSKSIPEMEAKLPQLNSLVALGKKIHMQGRLNFRAYIPLTEGELVLLRTGSEEPPVKEEKAKE